MRLEERAIGEAAGTILMHNVADEAGTRVLKKGIRLTNEHLAELAAMGRTRVAVAVLEEGDVHEDEAARRIAEAAAGPGITLSGVSEGRVNFEAAPGLLSVNVEALNRINSIEEVVLATMHDGQQVTEPRAVAGTRVVPLVVREEKILRVEAICAEYGHVVSVRPFRSLKVGVVTTGNEVFSGRIKDRFGPVIRKKFSRLGSSVMGQRLTSDDPAMTRDAILAYAAEGAEMIVVTGGMSVDPDDQTPTAIRATGAEIVTYGSPTFPGVMFLLAYLDGVPILGLPGCVMYYRASIFDLVVPRLLAGETVAREDIVALGHGGFCAACDVCRYPVCPFGK